MTKEIIEMAQECGLIGMRPHLDGIYSEALVAFAKLVAEKATAIEREACAKLAATPVGTIAAAIRARGQERLAQPEQTKVQQLIALVRAQQITIDKLEMALADPMREVQRLGQEIEQEPSQRTWIGLEGAEFGWFCHTDFLNARKYTKDQRKKICCQLLSEAQSWDIGEYQLMMHDSTKLKENT
jgi:hypothetical protein